ncbi:MAG TPA: hypothetical protein VK590_12705 [Saprospiraceae bacterium]|nr:hypothetical protein [Saprospiraceae bacterium]
MKIELINECSKKIIQYSLFIFGIDLIAFIGLFLKKENITIAGFTIPVEYASVSILICLMGYFLLMTHKFSKIISIYELSNEEEKNLILNNLDSNSSILNIFSKNKKGYISIIFDNLAFGIRNFFFFSALNLMVIYSVFIKGPTPYYKYFNFIFTVILFVYVYQERKLFKFFSPKEMLIKAFMSFMGIILPYLIFHLIFKDTYGT